MALCKIEILTFAVLVFYIPIAQCWGIDGHLIVCKLAQVLTFLNFTFYTFHQPRLSKAAEDAVSQLLPSYADNDLGSLCSWADRVKFRYHWSSPLHFINSPDDLCNYQYNSEHEIPAPFVIIRKRFLKYNLTEALLFLSHFMGDIHQVWDSSIIETAEETFYNSEVDELISALDKNISTVWSNQAKAWGACSKTSCPDVYASEGIKAACEWAYKGVEEDSVLGGRHIHTLVNLRLAQGGVRLAATLNRIFG
ncbi:hypothetical protein SASPL_142783 [Salvia splendens]|uniref:Aspergillus nuclease S1 n=1 Tax=Salvia splendens TaxID=180675 RepID=A0A8X8Z9P8_SALSN|nr:hypothetical protein SASPL_142783 [Salvia splendens]